MSDIAWPSTLPPPLRDGYAHALESSTERMDVEQGPARQWTTQSKRVRVVTLTWRFTAAEFATFHEWHHKALHDGANPFDIQLDDGRASTWWVARFLGPWQGPFKSGYRVLVSAQLYLVGEPTASRSDDVTLAATLLAGIRLQPVATQELIFSATLAGAIELAAAGAINVSADWAAELVAEFGVAGVGTEVDGTPADELLLEDGASFLLLESGDRILME